MSRTAEFNAELRYWEAHGALSWPTRDFLEIYRYAPITDNPAALKAIDRVVRDIETI